MIVLTLLALKLGTRSGAVSGLGGTANPNRGYWQPTSNIERKRIRRLKSASKMTDDIIRKVL
jgi:hypothetical protein